MDRTELDAVAQAGAAKYELCKSSLPRYVVRSILAGFYVSLGLFACNICQALFQGGAPGKVLGAFMFGLGLTAIVMLGGELFTGNNFTLGVAFLDRRVSLSGMIYTWVICYVGNLIGSVVISSFFVWGGSMNALLAPALAASAQVKLSLTVPQMVFRGIMCNFIVCASVLAGIKIKDAAAKILVILLLIAAFVLSGFEHSIANMGFYTLCFHLVPGTSPLLAARSMLWVTVGNILGGFGMLGLPYWFACNRKS